MATADGTEIVESGISVISTNNGCRQSVHEQQVETDPAVDMRRRVKAKVVLQQCICARLQVVPATEDDEAEFVEVGISLVIYVCFLKEATQATVEKMVKTALNTRLSEGENGRRVSILELPGDVLIIPQATLGGTIRSNAMQYHRNINKNEGEKLYNEFVKLCSEAVHVSEMSRDSKLKRAVKYGTYGNRQVFSTVTNGPYTHIVEFV